MDDFDQAMNWFLKSAWLACQPKPWQRLVEVAGVEPASLVLSYVASTCLAFNLLSSPDRLNASYPVSRLPKYN